MKSAEQRAPVVILTGGGTIGSVTPLLAMAEILQQQVATEFIWLGTANGPERQLVEEINLPFQAISAGKLRRYWSLDNFIDLGRIVGGFFQAYKILSRAKPKLVLSAGSFVSVPVVWAAKVLSIPVVIEQLDYRPGLANRVMAPWARQVLTTFAKSCQDYGAKAVWLGAPVRPRLLLASQLDETSLPWRFEQLRPVVLILGGGTGAAAINELVGQQLAKLLKAVNIIHLTGQGKALATAQPGYCPIEFLNQELMMAAYQTASLVVARAGLGTLIELATLKKPSIIIPMPGSHQLDNARAVSAVGAAIVAEEAELGDGKLALLVVSLIEDTQRCAELVSHWPQVIKIADDNEVVNILKKYL